MTDDQSPHAPWPPTSSGARAVAFLEGQDVDGAGRSVEEVLAFTDAELEEEHDYIQWLFPLKEASAAVPGSPVLMESDVMRIRQSASAQKSLCEATRYMLGFYRRSDHWLRNRDHNHLRITRIITSLRLLVGDPEADSFRSAIVAMVERNGSRVNEESRSYWEAA